jgi:hypothetical protein
MFRTDDDNNRFNRRTKTAAITILGLLCALLAGQFSSNAQQTGGSGRREVRVSVGHNSDSPQPAASREVRASWTSGGDRVEVRAKNVELTDDEASIKAIAADGYFVVEERRGGVERSLKAGRGATGQLQYSLSVQGEARKFDAEAQRWLSEVLSGFVRHSDFASESRFRRILKQQGPKGVFAEVSKLSSDYSKRLYLQMLLTEHKQSGDVQAQALEQAMREFSSTYEKAELLLWTLGQTEMSGQTRAAFFKAVEALNSDSDKGRVLAAVIKQDDSKAELRRLALRSAVHFKSDYDLAEFLIQLVRIRPLDATLRQEVLDAVKRLQSSYDQGRVLSALVEKEKG